MSRGKTSAAEKSLARAHELAPNDQSLKDLIVFYLLGNRTDVAKQNLEAIPNHEQTAAYYELAGMIAAQERKLQDSEAAYKKALEKDPGRLGTESLLFNHYLRIGRLPDAASLLDGIARRMPSNAMVPAMKGAVLEMQGNSKEAEENYRKALAANPNIDLAGNNLAYILAEDGRDLQTAQSLAEAARRRNPQSPQMADTLGWVYYKQDHLGLAKSQAEFAVSRQRENGVYQYHLGAIYEKCSLIPKAIAAFKNVVASPQTFKEKEIAEVRLKELLKGTPKKRESSGEVPSCGALQPEAPRVESSQGKPLGINAALKNLTDVQPGRE
jgi:tetratricopeptide (TPR) repeat protein